MQQKSVKKIINDPVHGFIEIHDSLILELINHPYFQRLRRINQLGLTSLVYPGATHSRFHHALGAMHLMSKALDTLIRKGVSISNKEKQGALMAILLHDIGHGPFSHVLEETIIQNTSHEELSVAFMEDLNRIFDGQLDLAIEIFKGTYPKHFLHQLVSGQLDMDRLDYLSRDSFYTGVSEGIVGLDRIIHMLNVVDNELVVEEKGIYSVEKFLVARRLMYWQVYLHKTAVAADILLINVLKRAAKLAKNGVNIGGSEQLTFFLKNDHLSLQDNRRIILDRFSLLDDVDMHYALKKWSTSEDKILAYLSGCMITRKTPRLRFSRDPIPEKEISAARKLVLEKFDEEWVEYLIAVDSVVNEAYRSRIEEIKILRKNGLLQEFTEVSDNYNFIQANNQVRKYYICTPK
jgi:HD superfamily phosphohydrolase